MRKIFVFFVVLKIVFASNLIEKGIEAYDDGDIEGAYQYWSKACDQGEGRGCTNLGKLFVDFSLLDIYDAKKAVKFYRKGCELNDVMGCYEAGNAYSAGVGVFKNEEKAKAFWRKACNMGKKEACFLVGDFSSVVPSWGYDN